MVCGVTGSVLSLAIAGSRIPYLERGVGSSGLYSRHDTKDLDYGLWKQREIFSTDDN